MNLIEKEFLSRALLSGKTYLFLATDAMALITRCETLNLRILGIDGFRVVLGVSRQPIQEHSIVFPDSSEYGYWLEAKEFIQKRESLGLYFEIVYD